MLGKLIALKSEDGVTTAHSIGNRMYGVGTEVFSQYLTLFAQVDALRKRSPPP